MLDLDLAILACPDELFNLSPPAAMHRGLSGAPHGSRIHGRSFFLGQDAGSEHMAWSQAGGIAHYGFAGMFWKAIPKENWPTDEPSLAFINEHWEEPFGDMRQELVFIGQGLDQDAMIQELDTCLLSDEDLYKGKQFWQLLADPFPVWNDNA